MCARFSLQASVYALAIVVGPLAGSASAANADKKATPPSAKDLIGAWIGFDRDELYFSRLELRSDSTGFFARVAPADTILHDYGVQVYRITGWKVDGWNLVIHLTPVSSNATLVYLRGRLGLFSLELEIGGPESKGWKRELLLYPESRIKGSNEETLSKIEQAEKNSPANAP
jgi:hypothetical protein